MRKALGSILVPTTTKATPINPPIRPPTTHDQMKNFTMRPKTLGAESGLGTSSGLLTIAILSDAIWRTSVAELLITQNNMP
jgi:hypothetical protein